MGDFKIGVMVESFRLGVRKGVSKAREIGASGIQVFAVEGEMDPDNMSRTGRRDFRHYVESLGLEISALCADLGGHGFEVARDNEWRIEKSKKIIDLARDLGTRVVTTHIGVLPVDPHEPRWQVMSEACEEIGTHAGRREVSFAVETGPEKVEVLKRFLDELKAQGVAVNYDPANLVMVAGDDPVAGVNMLEDYIVHTHAKDGVMLKQTDPKAVYDFFADGGVGDLRLGDYFEEKPLGEGDVDFDGYLEALAEVGFSGFLTIEREVGKDPVSDIIKAKKFLESKISQLGL